MTSTGSSRNSSTHKITRTLPHHPVPPHRRVPRAHFHHIHSVRLHLPPPLRRLAGDTTQRQPPSLRRRHQKRPPPQPVPPKHHPPRRRIVIDKRERALDPTQ